MRCSCAQHRVLLQIRQYICVYTKSYTAGWCSTLLPLPDVSRVDKEIGCTHRDCCIFSSCSLGQQETFAIVSLPLPTFLYPPRHSCSLKLMQSSPLNHVHLLYYNQKLSLEQKKIQSEKFGLPRLEAGWRGAVAQSVVSSPGLTGINTRHADSYKPHWKIPPLIRRVGKWSVRGGPWRTVWTHCRSCSVGWLSSLAELGLVALIGLCEGELCTVDFVLRAESRLCCLTCELNPSLIESSVVRRFLSEALPLTGTQVVSIFR